MQSAVRHALCRLWQKMNETQVHFPLNNRKWRAAKVVGEEAISLIAD
jgi:hypothetical protein